MKKTASNAALKFALRKALVRGCGGSSKHRELNVTVKSLQDRTHLLQRNPSEKSKYNKNPY